MNDRLKKILDGLANTPVEEPSIKDLPEGINKISLCIAVIEHYGGDGDDFTVEELSEFYAGISEKVLGYMDGNKTLKKTPNLSAIRPPKPKAMAEAMKKIDLITGDNEDEAFANKVKYIAELYGVEYAVLTSWEQGLLFATFVTTFTDFGATKAGKR